MIKIKFGNIQIYAWHDRLVLNKNWQTLTKLKAADGCASTGDCSFALR